MINSKDPVNHIPDLNKFQLFQLTSHIISTTDTNKSEKNQKLESLDKADGNQKIRGAKVKRSKFKRVNYIPYLFAATLLPLLNLLILYTQSYNLSWQNNFASINRQNYQFYYIGMSYYLGSILIFTFGTASTSISFRELVKLYLLMDSNQICSIAANLCYISLHLVYLCRDLTGNTYNINYIDILYLTLFALNNFSFLGYFRTTLVYYKWTPAKTLTFKILIFASSLTYFGYGIMIMIGVDNLSNLLTSASNTVQSFIQSTDFGSQTAQVQNQLLKQISSLSGNIATIQNLISLFVFTSFANICQVLSRMNDFDKCSNLKPMYEIDDQQQNHDQPIQQFRCQINHKFKNIMTQIKHLQYLKDPRNLYLSKNIQNQIQINNKQPLSSLPQA